MKILLLKWAEKVGGRSVDPSFVQDITGIYPPLGLLYIASSLIKAGFDVSVLDLPARKLDLNGLKDHLLKESYDIAGFTSTTLLWPQTAFGISFLKSVLPEAITVLGGPHTVLFYRECLALKDLDYVVVGEGEKSMVELASALQDGGSAEEIKGVAFRKGDDICFSGPRQLLDINEISFPARHLIDQKEYMSIMAKKPFATMVTSRGCPFRCHFCTQVYWQNRFRMRSADNVLQEIEEITGRYRVREIMMYDETFLIDKKRVLDISRGIEENRMKFRWDIRTRIDTIDDDVLEAIKKAGCYKVHVGIESGTDRILGKMNKNICTQEIRLTVNKLKKYGFEVLGYFMIGYSGETLEEIQETIRFSLSLPLDWAHFNITLPVPAVPLFDDAVQKGIIKQDYWSRYTLLEGDVEPPPYFPDSGLSQVELEALLKKAYRKFYIRPSKIFNCSVKMMDKDRIKNSLTGFLSLFR